MVSTITLCEGGGVNIPDLCHAVICPHALQCWGGGRENAPVFLPKEKSVLIVITFGKGSQISTAKYNKRHPSPLIGGHGSVKAHVATHHSLRRRPHAHACWPAMIWHGAVVQSGSSQCPSAYSSASRPTSLIPMERRRSDVQTLTHLHVSHLTWCGWQLLSTRRPQWYGSRRDLSIYMIHCRHCL